MKQYTARMPYDAALIQKIMWHVNEKSFGGCEPETLLINQFSIEGDGKCTLLIGEVRNNTVDVKGKPKKNYLVTDFDVLGLTDFTEVGG